MIMIVVMMVVVMMLMTMTMLGTDFSKFGSANLISRLSR